MTQASDPLVPTTWSVRGYQPGEERLLVDLFQRVFNRSITIDHWRWKLKTLPAPCENVWLAVHQDMPIFQYAGIPLRCNLFGRERVSMVSVDTMTAPEFQKRGLLTQVGRFAYDQWRAASAAFVIGLPNERWGSRTNALGWIDLFPLQWLTRPLRPEVLLARRSNLRALARLTWIGSILNRWWDRSLQPDRSISIRSIQQAGSEFDQVWNKIRSTDQISVVRDSTWVNWRYLTAPMFDYRVLFAERSGQPLGYAAYRIAIEGERKIGYIAEVIANPQGGPVWKTLLSQVLRALREARVETAVTLAVPDTLEYAAFRRNGFFGRAAFNVQMVPLDSQLPIERLQDRASWLINGSDFDVI
jgi:hypothetical protein